MPKFFKSVNTFLNNKIGKEMGKLDPRVSGLLGSFFPGLGGGVENYQDNAFLSAIQNQSEQLQLGVQNAGKIQIKSDELNRGTKPFDWRARLRPKNGGADTIYQADNEGILSPLKKVGGMIWQTTPQIFLAGTVEYNEHLGHGMNYPVYTYNNSRPPRLPINADFFANDIYEAQYLLAVMHFIRSVSKSYFGEAALQGEDKARYGTPPPVLIFEYLGHHGFNKVPVILSGYSIELNDSVDYIPVTSVVKAKGSDKLEEQTTFVPTRANIMVELAPAYTPKKVREKFDVEAFRNGSLYRDGFI